MSKKKIEEANETGVSQEEWLLAERQAYDAQIVKGNAKFARLSAADKRVAIARDVLEWLRFGKLRPVNGCYIDIEEDEEGNTPERVNGYECQACALGSIFAVAVERDLVDQSLDSDEFIMRDSLLPYFSEDQLFMIEDGFEGGSLSLNRRAERFNDHLTRDRLCNDDRRGAHERMRRVMQNIIDNHGTFAP